MVKQEHKVTIITSEMTLIPDSLTSFFGKNNTEQTGISIILLQDFLSRQAILGKEMDNVISFLAPNILYVHGNDTVTGMKYISKIGKLPSALVDFVSAYANLERGHKKWTVN